MSQLQDVEAKVMAMSEQSGGEATVKWHYETYEIHLTADHEYGLLDWELVSKIGEKRKVLSAVEAAEILYVPEAG